MHGAAVESNECVQLPTTPTRSFFYFYTLLLTSHYRPSFLPRFLFRKRMCASIAYYCVYVHGNKKKKWSFFPHCLYIFVSKEKKTKKGQLKERITTVSTPKKLRVWERESREREREREKTVKTRPSCANLSHSQEWGVWMYREGQQHDRFPLHFNTFCGGQGWWCPKSKKEQNYNNKTKK